MSFWHEGARVTHPRLYRAFLRGVEFAEEEGVFIVRLGRFRGQIEVEDIAWWVVAYEADCGSIRLTDESEEPLRPETLSVDPDEALRCTVKGRFPARFTRAGQAHLLDNLDTRGEGFVLRIGERWVPVPGLRDAGP
jgi:hypothetical protein